MMKSVGVWVAVAMLGLTVQLAAAQAEAGRTSCRPQDCVPIQDCPVMGRLIRTGDAHNIDRVRNATCFINGRTPMVCCPGLPTNCGHSIDANRVHGGNVTVIGSYSWMAVLGYSVPGESGIEYMCGGSVISDRYVLTAAHCVSPRKLGGRKLEEIRLREWDLGTEEDCEVTLQGFRFCARPTITVTYDRIIIHPQYDERNYESDDIALIRINRPIDFVRDEVHPVCVPPQGVNAKIIAGRREPIVAGWGLTENGTTSDRMLHVALPFANSERCSEVYRGRLVDGQLCLGGRKGQDSCSGDSGGPVVLQGPTGPPYVQVGIVSYGPQICGQEDVPAIYTDVSYYNNWIEEQLVP